MYIWIRKCTVIQSACHQKQLSLKFSTANSLIYIFSVEFLYYVDYENSIHI